MFFDLPGHEARFGFRVKRLKITNPLARRVLGPEGFFFALNVVLDETAGEVEDVLRRTVVLFESNDLRRRKMLLKLQNVRDVGAAPAVNRLVRIAYDTDVLLPLCEQADQSK